jgi:hypothetical protein
LSPASRRPANDWTAALPELVNDLCEVGVMAGACLSAWTGASAGPTLMLVASVGGAAIQFANLAVGALVQATDALVDLCSGMISFGMKLVDYNALDLQNAQRMY